MSSGATCININKHRRCAVRTCSFAADRAPARIVMALAARSVTFPRKRLVRNFTSRFGGNQRAHMPLGAPVWSGRFGPPPLPLCDERFREPHVLDVVRAGTEMR